jgi:hypothetical protein
MKHVGKHGDKKIVLIFREVPDEGHMCLLIYSDVLPRMIHDEVMKVVESDLGQNAKEISDVLHRSFMPDGRKILEVLHREGMIKKVPTNQVLITPNNKSSVRLDELNKILNEMAQGEDAIKRLAELDKNAGMTGKRGRPADPREVGMPANSRANAPVEGNTAPESLVAGVLSDADLANQRAAQAATMRKNAESMLAEAARLEAEAQSLNPTPVKANGTRKTTKTTTKAKATKKQEA